MEKIIFFGLVIPIMAYVLYLGGMAIMNGFKSKEVNRAEKEEDEIKTTTNISILSDAAIFRFPYKRCQPTPSRSGRRLPTIFLERS